MLILIAAITENYAIGKDNDMIYHISEDLKYFKKVTMGSTIIMGRKTFESIGKPLPGRHNIIVTKGHVDIPEIPENTTVEVISDLKSIIKRAKESEDKYFVIGGGEIYRQTIGYADMLYITVIRETVKDADVFFPLIPYNFYIESKDGPFIDDKTGVEFMFYRIVPARYDMDFIPPSPPAFDTQIFK